MSAIGGTRKKLLLATSGLAAVLFAVPSAFAQEQVKSEQGEKVELQTITVKKDSAKGLDPASIPASVSRVDRQQIEREGSVKIDDLLRTLPGTFTRENMSQPGVAVNIRGFEGSGRVNMMVDGVRQNFRFTGHEASGFTYVDSNLLADIDVARGAVTGAGGGGLAGSVNFRTLGVDDIIRDGQQYGVLGRASWGSNGVGFSEMIAGGARVNSMGIAAAISRRDSNNFKDGNGDVQSNTWQDLTSGLVKAEFGFAEDHKLNLGGVFYNNKFGANSYDQRINNSTLSANYAYTPTDNDLIDLRVNAFYNDLKMEYFDNLSGTWGSASGRVLKDRGVGFDIANTSRFNVDEVAVSWKYGVEYFRDKLTTVNPGVNPGNGTSSSGAVFSETKFTYGIADLIVGLRYNFYKTKGDASNGNSLVDQSHNAFDPSVTLALNPTDWLQPYVTYSRTMRVPTLQETMVGGVHPGGGTGMIANPDLEPEKQQGWEIGANIRKNDLFTADDALRLKASYYDMDVDNYIISAYNPLYRGYQYVNAEGKSRVRGFELGATYDAGFAFGGLSYTHSKSDLPAQTPGFGAGQYLPDNIFNLSAGVRMLDRKLTLGAQYRYISGGDEATYTGIAKNDDSYGLVDVFANYKFTDDVDLTLKINNLTNKEYKPFLSTSGNGQGRTFLVSTQFKF